MSNLFDHPEDEINRRIMEATIQFRRDMENLRRMDRWMKLHGNEVCMEYDEETGKFTWVSNLYNPKTGEFKDF